MGLVNERVRPFVQPVGLSNSLEKKFGWLAFPGLIRGITILHVMMFVVLVFTQNESALVFNFDWEKIKEGEFWRIFSFILLPPIFPGEFLFVSVIFLLIGARIAFMFNDGLEEAWGVFRTSIYCYSTIVCILISNFLSVHFGGPLVMSGGAIFYSALFFAFATIFPHVQFLLFFIIPVKIWVLAIIAGAVIALGSFVTLFKGEAIWATYSYICFLPYLVWAVPRFLAWNRTRTKTAVRRAKFKAHQVPPSEAFHTCEQCGATDVSQPEREFRVTEDDRELCSACLETGTSGASGS